QTAPGDGTNGHRAVSSPLMRENGAWFVRSGQFGPNDTVAWTDPVRIDDDQWGVWHQLRSHHDLHELAIRLFELRRERDPEWAQRAIHAQLVAVQRDLSTAAVAERP